MKADAAIGDKNNQSLPGDEPSRLGSVCQKSNQEFQINTRNPLSLPLPTWASDPVTQL